MLPKYRKFIEIFETGPNELFISQCVFSIHSLGQEGGRSGGEGRGRVAGGDLRARRGSRLDPPEPRGPQGEAREEVKEGVRFKSSAFGLFSGRRRRATV